MDLKGIAPAHLSGTQDLLTLFKLSPSYDTYVRPYLSVAKQQAGQHAAEDVKGKGRAVNGQDGDVQAAVDTTTAGAGAKDRTRIMKKHYSHMIQDVPGQFDQDWRSRLETDKRHQVKTSWRRTIIYGTYS